MKTIRALLWSFLISHIYVVAPAEDWTGQYVAVTDGDMVQGGQI